MSTNSHHFSRRKMLSQCSTGFGLVALSSLLKGEGQLAAGESNGGRDTFGPSPPHVARKAKSVIFCFMSGGVSHVDSFDPKPRLQIDHGKPMPVKVEQTMFNNNGNIMQSPWKFHRHGKCGLPVSELFPHIGSCADDLAVIRSMTSIANEHAQGNYFLHTGFSFSGSPSAGAWMTYGLGTQSKNLPGFVVLSSGGIPLGGVNIYGNGYLPAIHQASLIDPTQKEPLNNINPREPDSLQKKRLRFVDNLDRVHLAKMGGEGMIDSAIRNYEIAYRMQSAVPDLVDLNDESMATRALYGMDSPVRETAEYGRQCLFARRLVERGVRFVELTCLPRPAEMGQVGNPWDQHGSLFEGHSDMAKQVDQPIAGLLKDLKQRGLLEETLVIWAGEFGRTPFAQGSNGRDHNPMGFSVWMAGGGTRGGTVYGATDDLGYRAVEGVSTVYDLWATVLHLLGIDHEALTYRYGGRDMRLTDVHGNVIKAILN